ncbi:hypothetical protein [Bosea sp. BIWAKO-01]|uniref:hypothetical protein n=1 Tax=Bosea sp. BIWAKO-01 TaxID=506668 RepID=UPI00159EFC3B|nr:hypothetical protein [Bosea sp. BIWAKO-01]
MPAGERRSAQKVSANPRRAGSVTAGKSRGITAGEQIPTATSQKWKSACAQTQDVAAGPQPEASLGQDQAETEGDAEEELDHPDVANEMLVEEAGVGHARHQFVPGQGGDEHEEAIRGQELSR